MVGIVTLGVLLLDVLLPRKYEITTNVVVAAIVAYRGTISPLLTGRVVCRFEPTCSAYGLEAVREDGAVAGGARTAWRIARCGPWTEQGTVDYP